MHPDQLAALVAVIEGGSFEAAARALHVTPSAISQRIKALERHFGRVLVVRASPCRATDTGQAVLRHARQVAQLRADLHRELDPEVGGRRPLPVVVNADSLATWFVPVLAEAATWGDVTVEVLIEIEDHGTRHLRSGEAVAAVTSEPVVVPGCTVEALGVLRYVPVCHPRLWREHERGGSVDWARLPMVRFNRDDDLQHRLLARLEAPEAEVVHLVPEHHAFRAAVCVGLGWGVLPEPQADELVAAGDLIRLGERECVDVQLSWQSWRLGSAATTRLTAAVHRAARAGLHPPRRGRP